MFDDFFHEENVEIETFPYGKEFLGLTPTQINKYDYILVNHTLLDMRGVDLIRELPPERGEICIISTYGNAVTPLEKDTLGITGDFEKIDRESILNWYKKTVMEKQD